MPHDAAASSNVDADRECRCSSLHRTPFDCGVLGEALAANHRGRLAKFIVDETSPAIAIFAPAHAHANHDGDWYGEHAGKWLYAASKAAARTGDAALVAIVSDASPTIWSACRRPTATSGNYAPERRFMRKQPPKPVSWDGAPSVRTWDIWTHSYLILGLLEAHRHLGSRHYLRSGVQDRRPVLAHADERRHRHHRPRQSSRHVGDRADGSRARAVLRHRRAALSSTSRCACWSRPSAIRGWRC